MNKQVLYKQSSASKNFTHPSSRNVAISYNSTPFRSDGRKKPSPVRNIQQIVSEYLDSDWNTYPETCTTKVSDTLNSDSNTLVPNRHNAVQDMILNSSDSSDSVLLNDTTEIYVMDKENQKISTQDIVLKTSVPKDILPEINKHDHVYESDLINKPVMKNSSTVLVNNKRNVFQDISNYEDLKIDKGTSQKNKDEIKKTGTSEFMSETPQKDYNKKNIDLSCEIEINGSSNESKELHLKELSNHQELQSSDNSLSIKSKLQYVNNSQQPSNLLRTPLQTCLQKQEVLTNQKHKSSDMKFVYNSGQSSKIHLSNPNPKFSVTYDEQSNFNNISWPASNVPQPMITSTVTKKQSEINKISCMPSQTKRNLFNDGTNNKSDNNIGKTSVHKVSEEKNKDKVIKSLEGNEPRTPARTKFCCIFKEIWQDNLPMVINKKLYLKINRIGKGGSSEVYHVLDARSFNSFAVKCVNLRSADEGVVEGYKNEIDTLSRLQHYNTVVKLIDYEYQPSKGILYIILEKGDVDLSKILKEVSQISLANIIQYWTEMLNAVRDIHNEGIIHSDLKPLNFLIVSGRLKIIDFGISSSLQEDVTSIVKSTQTGTLNYISPEALDDNVRISRKSDIWSLGCILYNMVYGKTPFQGIKNLALKVALIKDPNYKISFPEEEGNFTKELLQAVKWCLTHNPKERPTIDQLLDIPYIRKE